MKLFYILVFCLLGFNSFAKKLSYGVNYVDINNDKQIDMIVKFRVAKETAHSYDKYVLLLKNGDIYKQLKVLQTLEGADCKLSEYQFSFNRDFSIVEYKRDLGNSYYSKEDVYENIYKLKFNEFDEYKLILESSVKLPGKHCDVKNFIK